MAAALSRALKLPGKKGSELGEYDPLTQADSEDDSEEDDLVLNYPRNGLGRGNCMGSGTTDMRGGRVGRLMEDEDDVDERDEDEEEWREQHLKKNRQERDDLKSRQYWSQREGRDLGFQDGGGPGSTRAGGLGLDSGSDPEAKRIRMRGTIRTTVFLVPLCCAVLLVLLCAFLLPCQQGELNGIPQWETGLGEVGVNSPPLALWDVDNDTIEDVLVSVTQLTNDSRLGGPQGNSKEHSVAAVSAVRGNVLWKTGLKEPALSIQCGMRPQARPVAPPRRTFPQRQSVSGPAGQGRGPICLVTGSAHLSALDAATGKMLWTVSPGQIVSQVVSVPDLTGDAVPDLLIAALPPDQASDLSLMLLSGVSGGPIGHPVTFNVTTQGKLIGPELHVTKQRAYYILFGLGTVEAVWLTDIYTQATSNAPSRTKVSPALRVKEPSWEKMHKPNSSLIHISSGPDQVDFFLPMAAGLCSNHNNLYFQFDMNASSSNWAVVYGSRRLSVLKEQDAQTEWMVSTAAIQSRPTPGYFNGDRIPDLLIQQSAGPGVRKVQVINGASGQNLWEAEFVCPRIHLQGSSLLTSSGQSAFLFWAGDIQRPQNLSIATPSPVESPADPVLRKLYLLHPAYPTILVELTSTTDTILTAAVSYQEQQKDASYVTVSSRHPPTGPKPDAQVVKHMRLKALITDGRVLWLGEARRASQSLRPGDFEINKFFRQLSFRPHQ
ncbi:protein FAM234B isoform X2 [Brienomyrus brachyistius]|nr:protein FAM234B isoform X2 [Brienomyrus brachyistius]